MYEKFLFTKYDNSLSMTTHINVIFTSKTTKHIKRIELIENSVDYHKKWTLTKKCGLNLRQLLIMFESSLPENYNFAIDIIKDPKYEHIKST